MKLPTLTGWTALGLATTLSLAGTRAVFGEPEADKTQWFRDAKFGIFMHWGLYSEIGNEWQGKLYHGSGEWIMNRAKIPAAEYAREAATFDPTNFEADAIAQLVQDAGARYLVITAKHHEGFAMFGSKVSPFNIVEATPYCRPPAAEPGLSLVFTTHNSWTGMSPTAAATAGISRRRPRIISVTTGRNRSRRSRNCSPIMVRLAWYGLTCRAVWIGTRRGHSWGKCADCSRTV
jgi:hypothetical protein